MSIPADPRRDQRLVYCGALRARLRPYFLRSFMRGSRVRKPAWRSGSREPRVGCSSARAMPWRMAPAWPDAAALDLDHRVVAALGAGDPEGHQDVGQVDGVAEVLLEAAAVDDDLALAGDAGGRGRCWSCDGRCAWKMRPWFMRWDLLPCAGSAPAAVPRAGCSRAGVDLELAQLLHAQLVVRQHALDGAADDLLGSPLEQVAERLLAEAARVAAVARVDLVAQLVAGDTMTLPALSTMTWSPVSMWVAIGRLVLARRAAARRARRAGRASGRPRRRRTSWRSISLARGV